MLKATLQPKGKEVCSTPHRAYKLQGQRDQHQVNVSVTFLLGNQHAAPESEMCVDVHVIDVKVTRPVDLNVSFLSRVSHCKVIDNE